MSKRQKQIRAVVIGVILAVMLALGFVLMTWEKAKAADVSWVEQGNAELLDPQGFYQPYSALQVGRNCYENIIHGTTYTVPASCEQGDILIAMLEYHALREGWFSWVFSDGRVCLDHDTCFMIVSEAVARWIDYRVTIPILEFESSMGLAGDLYGWKNGCSGSWKSQTVRTFDRWVELGIASNPIELFTVWHDKSLGGYPVDPYVVNCMNTYRGCDGGDLQ